jgi:tetratricopeptide (TPR) repeat protein
MNFGKCLNRFIFVIFLSKIIVIFDHNLAWAKGDSPHNHIMESHLYSQNDDQETLLRLEESLEIVQKMDDSQLKVMILNDIALNYANLGNQQKARAILEQSLSICDNLTNIEEKITNMLNIAKSYQQLGAKTKSIEILNDAIKLTNRIEDKTLQGQLLLQISLKYEEIGVKELAQNIFEKGQTVIAETSKPQAEFPFKETPSTFKLGISGSINSFRDTTALLGFDIDFAKQWSEDDIFIDGSVYLDYDSSRSVNNYRPSSLLRTYYRHHFNSKWSFFTDFFNSTNQSFYSSKNDDEDLVIVNQLFVGPSLNLWRGDSRGDFLDVGLGIGPRYEYDYIDLEERRNQIVPTFGILFFGRGISLGEAKLNHSLGFIPALNDLNNYIISGDTTLSFPLTENWFFNNRLFVRYRNELIFEDNPKLEFYFSTGLQYQF